MQLLLVKLPLSELRLGPWQGSADERNVDLGARSREFLGDPDKVTELLWVLVSSF